MSIQVSNIKIISRESQQQVQSQQVPDIKQINIPKTETHTQTQKNNNYSNHFIKNKKIPFNINVDIQNISDLISITDKYKFDNKFYYNINLKALHNIKDDLILLNNMIGLHSFKTSILDQLLYFLQNFHKGPKKNDNSQYNNQIPLTHTNQQQSTQTQQQYIPPTQPSYLNYLYPPAPQPSLDVYTTNDEGDFKHTVIYGPPGTGKTEVAKILGKIYSKIGVLNNNIFKKVTKNDLVGQYLGQTAIKTKNVINQCLGGVLFIDEAYSLGSKDSIDIFSKECIDTLCEALSSHKNDLMVIIAGYEKELDENFFSVNQGLNSRFIWRYNIEKYSTKELMDIFIKKVNEAQWTFKIPCEEKWFESKKYYFTNYGRDMENLFLSIKIVHSRRIFGKQFEEKKMITIEDIDKGFKKFCENPEVKKRELLNSNKNIISSLYS
jgi:hypothetical protein